MMGAPESPDGRGSSCDRCRKFVFVGVGFKFNELLFHLLKEPRLSLRPAGSTD